MSQNFGARISKIENEYYLKIKNLTGSKKINDFKDYTDLSANISDVYFDTCSQLLSVVTNLSDNPFTFKKYIEKRAFLKIHNDSILDDIYLQCVQVFL